MEFRQVMNDILYVVLTVILPIVATYLVNYLKSQIKESNIIGEITKNENINNLIEEAMLDIMDAVLYVNQTYTDSLKKAGKFDEAAQKEAFNLAYQKALQLISDETKDLIESVYGSFDEWLSLKIESSVNKAKKEQ